MLPIHLNLGCGQDFPAGDWLNLDRFATDPRVVIWDVDDHTPPLEIYHDNDFVEIRCWGCLNEFKTDVLAMMREFYRVLRNGGLLDIRVALVPGAFRDPIARRYLNEQWLQYFIVGGAWENSGRGFGFDGRFRVVTNEVAGETHHVVLEAIK